MTSPAPLALSISSQLIQDYLYINDPPPPALAEQGSLVAIDGGLLAIDGTTVSHFELEPTSEGGWRTSTITVPVPPTAADSNIMMIKAFILQGNKDGSTPTSTLNLLCFYASDGWAEGGGTQPAYAVAWLIRETGGTWQNALLSTEAIGLLSQVQSVDVFDAGAGKGKFVYGLTTSILGQTNSQMFVLKIWNYNDITTIPWQIASQCTVPNLPAERMFFMASGDPGTARPVSLCLRLSGGQSTTLLWSEQLAVDEEAGPDISAVHWAGQQTIPAALREFRTVDGLSQWTAMAVDTQGIVYRLVFPAVSGQSCAMTALNQGTGPTNVTSVSVTRRVGQAMSMFAVGDGQLWLTRDVENVNWVQLGDPVVQLATPQQDPAVFEVYYADPTATQANRIYHLSQDAGQSVWKRQTLATFTEATFVQGAAGPKEVGTISIELSVTHQNSRAAAQNALISVSSDQWVVLLADTLSYWVGPGTDQQIPADKLGLLTVRYHATDLKFPHLTFYATEQGRPNSAVVGCRGDIVDGDTNPSTSTIASRLAGQGNDSEFTMSAATLKTHNLLHGGSDDGNTTHCINQLGTYMVNSYAKANGAPAMAATPPGTRTTWTFTRSENQVRCEVSVGKALESDLGSFGDDAADVLNFLSHAAHQVGTFAVSLGDDVATVTVGLYTFAVHTARQAGDAIGTIFANVMAGFRALEDVLHDLIEFLKMLFEWGDILDTHKALKTLLSWGVNYLPANMDAAKNWLDGQLGGLANDITSAVSKAESYLQKNDLTGNGYAQANNLQTPNQSQPDLGGSVYQSHMTNHKARCNYLVSRARPHVTAVTQKAGNNASVSDAMNASFAGPNITGQQTTFLPGVQTLLMPDGVADATKVLEASALALLQLSKDLINDAVIGIEAVVNAVLEAIASAAEWFASTLSDPLEVPVISWLYSSLIEETLFPSNNNLSVLDLFCLILAAPVTILYKLVRNGEAPFGGSRLAAITAAFGNPAQTNFGALANFGADTMLAASSPQGIAIAAEVLGCVAGCLDLFSGVVGTLADMIAMANQTLGMDTTPAQALFAWVSWALSTLTTLCEAPIGTFASFAESGNLPVGIIKTVFFGLEVLPNIGDFICLAASKTSVMRMIPNSGAYWDGGCGLVIIGGAMAYIITAAIEGQDDAWDYINAVISNINRPFRLMMPWLTGGDLLALAVIAPVIVATDVVATVGGVVTQIGSSVRG